MTVVYDPAHPDQAAIVGQGRLGPAVLIALAAGVFGLGLLMVAEGLLGFPR